jgi:hypothetical protein
MKYMNHRIYDRYKEAVQEHPLRDAHGEEYLAVAPIGYRILGYFNRGGECFATEVMHEKSRQHRMLKTYIDGTQWTWRNVVDVEGIMLSQFALTGKEKKGVDSISVPKIYEAGIEFGRYNYVIEEKKYGVRLTEEVLDSLSRQKKMEVIGLMGDFLYSIHSMKQRAEYTEMRKIPMALSAADGYDEIAPIRKIADRGTDATVVHRDFVPKNILFNEGKLGEISISVVDWAGSIKSNILYEFLQMARHTEGMYGFNRDPNAYDSEYYMPETINMLA